MIITKLQGGIGNQMFQYSVGKKLALSNHTNLKLDISWYKTVDRNYRKFELNHFNINAEIANDKEIAELKPSRFNKIKMAILGKHFIKEKSFLHFDPDVLRAKKNSCLLGYWQSEKYFYDIADILLSEFTLKDPIFKKAAGLLDSIKMNNSVSIHIRRGDYLSPQFQNVYMVCPPEYYERAISLIKSKTSSPHFFVFSDDSLWVKTLSFPKETTYITSDLGFTDYEELALMSECKHNITANSTFGWWGAWLNKNPQKIIITPKKWFLNDIKNVNDITPQSWVRL